jgi:hypothetical protein
MGFNRRKLKDQRRDPPRIVALMSRTVIGLAIEWLSAPLFQPSIDH